MNNQELKRLHKDVCMVIETYEFEDEHLNFNAFKTIIENYCEVDE